MPRVYKPFIMHVYFWHPNSPAHMHHSKVPMVGGASTRGSCSLQIMVEKPDAIDGMFRRLKHSSETEKRTLLPKIESERRPENPGLNGARRASSLNVAGNAPRSQRRSHTQQSQWEIHPSRLSGVTNLLQSDGLSYTHTHTAFPTKKGQHQLSVTNKDDIHERSVKSDKGTDTREEQKLLGKVKAKKSCNSTRPSMKPLQFPVVTLKSPLSDLHSPSPGPTQKDACTNKSPNESWEPFSCVCKYCGLKFGKHSILIHEKKCCSRSSKQQSQNQGLKPSDEFEFGDSTPSVGRPQPVARIVTIGLGSAPYNELTVFASLPPRPETQTLRHSSLRDSGYGLPYVPSASDSQPSDSSEMDNGRCKHKMTLCDRCGRVVATDRVKVHSRLCKPETLGVVKTSSVKFPSTCNLLKVEQSSRHPKTSVKKPPTVVCYICGKEYGTKSILIHEPQCLKKFEIENRKLPINKRKPLPKKLVEERTKVARFVSVEDEMVVINSQPANHYPYKDLVDETVDFIFQQCYSDFERELVPCKRCGRKFAPERHEIHEPNCNAEPLKRRK